MKEGPDIARIGSLIGDPARANILTALMSGKALTASELAGEAGVTLQTASSHLSKLEDARLIFQRKQGRHRYYTLADDDVGSLLEAMMGFAAKRGLLRTRTGPADEALRKARICYDHLAGELGVSLYNGLAAGGHLEVSGENITLSESGNRLMAGFGIDLTALKTGRRPLCKSCLDWSERRTHLAGALGSALLDRFYDLGWARRAKNSRVIEFSREGEAALAETFCARQAGL
ncbi:ArsR/SmtB family transcription factor [Salaquimonas pukyongi]|uniref:ArsR/SmtB family transcription factor n=1 Tax=Salaquimonas pukyongi TaxID=2712698 RepID=UPI00096B68D7|nr:winged helix-turn-helix domain-containing protein [Salaquimonas pukyongi]